LEEAKLAYRRIFPVTIPPLILSLSLEKALMVLRELSISMPEVGDTTLLESVGAARVGLCAGWTDADASGWEKMTKVRIRITEAGGRQSSTGCCFLNSVMKVVIARQNTPARSRSRTE
jgi:hypothetical protein